MWITALKRRQFLFQLLAVGLIMILVAASTGIFPSTEIIAAAFVFSFMWTRSGRHFLLEFAPFLLLLLTYKQMRNFADDLTANQINVANLVRWEKDLFGGTLPNYWVQQHMWGKPYTPILDVITNTLYLSHFLSPLVISVVLWQKDRRLYWAFAIGLVALSYAAFTTYVLFPAAPPWWATLYGYIKDQPVVLDHFVTSGEALAKGANPVAAMPSLHAAYPTYIALVSISIWGKKGIPVILLPVGVIFATIYLGHHYVIDAIAGSTYALVSFTVIYPLAKRFTASHKFFAPESNPILSEKTQERTVSEPLRRS